jgi:hypothetical protein
MAFVYLHKRADNNQVFYVGISKNKSRAYEVKSYRRNVFWNNIYKKCGLKVELSHTNVCWEEACVIEKYLINFYRSFNDNTLCNVTDGGEGVLGLNVPEERKLIYSQMYKGKSRSEDDKQKMRKPKLTGTNSLKGKKLSDEHRLKLSLARKGKKLKPLSEEHKNKLSAAKKGILFTEEHKRNISKAAVGRVFGQETRKKMSESHLKKVKDERTSNCF